MRARSNFFVAAATACTLSGCANFSDVLSDERDGSYNLSTTGISYTMSMDELTAVSRNKASAYCAGQDKEMQLRQQARGWRPMQVELNFRCLPRQVGQIEAGNSLTAFK